MVKRIVAVAALLLAGCGSTTASPTTGQITVFAAASLTESFTKLGKEFEAAHPGTKVTFNFAGSSALAQQINKGAPADVFASAAPANMKQVTDTGAITATPTTFARNTLQIAVPKGKNAGLAFLRTVVEEAKQSGLVARAIEKTGARGVAVAPLATQGKP